MGHPTGMSTQFQDPLLLLFYHRVKATSEKAVSTKPRSISSSGSHPVSAGRVELIKDLNMILKLANVFPE